ncbi:similar to Saccharomyces cerevisiae YGL213C SKI8 Ski complex component and WD-repeat protein, mediates 3'-5' RNA degradation by the cytoplasmic exosome [Maudiozyma saulgeensis]|uniref:Similar to Saccharomyces cerevisiae YGL213C SKI8 Ski complex component and WD-repeat protein, mediates 3'-5' RNA degradation by the cytoplasmic exosome n=1 Tax=Maudiozyma saulgeensis TaxID=1789683 RepID=A0A1X7QXB8_9SACH|nr:similar to Saccharomyces cerevisiae YGL213C SKI8 Ski complex component and WD-repeat protein, mediates 3'-5' RNA degradation by the cytoplasmic exosome [Kazachstania saulgeensis]
MSKVFIPIANVGKAHEADIYSVTITNPYSISCGGDGYLKLWPNKTLIQEQSRLKDIVISKFVHKTGLHHADAIYTVEPHDVGTVLLIATVSFSGNIHFYQFLEDTQEFKELNLIDDDLKKKSFWSCKWVKSNDQVVNHRFIATDVKGNTYVWKFMSTDKIVGDDEEKPEYKKNLHFEFQGEIPSNEPVFATCVTASSSKGLLATGFANGSVIVSQLSTLRPLYTFEGLGREGVDQNSNSVRSVAFSPAGNLLSVANDSGSYGCVTLYETEYGERIGNLTVPTHSGQTNIGLFAHNGWVFNQAFNPSGEFIATCGYDGKVRVWDVKSKERVSTLNISATDIEIEEDIMLADENGDSLKVPPVFDVQYIPQGTLNGVGNETNEGLCCVCMDRSVRWFREAGGK